MDCRAKGRRGFRGKRHEERLGGYRETEVKTVGVVHRVKTAVGQEGEKAAIPRERRRMVTEPTISHVVDVGAFGHLGEPNPGARTFAGHGFSPRQPFRIRREVKVVNGPVRSRGKLKKRSCSHRVDKDLSHLPGNGNRFAAGADAQVTCPERTVEAHADKARLMRAVLCRQDCGFGTITIDRRSRFRLVRDLLGRRSRRDGRGQVRSSGSLSRSRRVRLGTRFRKCVRAEQPTDVERLLAVVIGNIGHAVAPDGPPEARTDTSCGLHNPRRSILVGQEVQRAMAFHHARASINQRHRRGQVLGNIERLRPPRGGGRAE